MRIKCVVIKALAADFEQLKRLTSAAGLVLLSRYFEDTCDRKVAAAYVHMCAYVHVYKQQFGMLSMCFELHTGTLLLRYQQHINIYACVCVIQQDKATSTL